MAQVTFDENTGVVIPSTREVREDLAQAVQDAEVPGLAIGVDKAAGEKCERCWIYNTELGTDPEHPTLCPRCAAALKELA